MWLIGDRPGRASASGLSRPGTLTHDRLAGAEAVAEVVGRGIDRGRRSTFAGIAAVLRLIRRPVAVEGSPTV